MSVYYTLVLPSKIVDKCKLSCRFVAFTSPQKKKKKKKKKSKNKLRLSS